MRPDHSSMEWRFSRAPGTSLVCNRNDETMSFNHYPCSKTAPLHEMKTRISILHIIPVFHSLGVIEISCPIYLLISSNLPSRPTLPFPSSYSSFSYIFPLHFPPRLFFFISFFPAFFLFFFFSSLQRQGIIILILKKSMFKNSLRDDLKLSVLCLLTSILML